MNVKAVKNDAIVVLSSRIARVLLHEGYQITDIKPHKQDKARTVFVFVRDDSIEKRISDLSKDNKEKSLESYLQLTP